MQTWHEPLRDFLDRDIATFKFLIIFSENHFIFYTINIKYFNPSVKRPSRESHVDFLTFENSGEKKRTFD